MTTQLSPNFTLEQMLKSPTATRNQITEQFTPSQDVIDSLKALCINVLEPLLVLGKAKWGETFRINITSGYRCLRTNTAVGGSKTSQHMKGEAADTEGYVGDKEIAIEDWYQFVKSSGVSFDQLIQEFNAWGHISYAWRELKQRRSCLRATHDNGKVVYKAE